MDETHLLVVVTYSSWHYLQMGVSLVMILGQMLRIVNLLELVSCNHLVSILLDVLELIGDPVLDDVGPHVDN